MNNTKKAGLIVSQSIAVRVNTMPIYGVYLPTLFETGPLHELMVKTSASI